jgi:formylglycine-generating enzyme required for sulfatase activity
MHGNDWEWCQNASVSTTNIQEKTIAVDIEETIDLNQNHLILGGSYVHKSSLIRSVSSSNNVPWDRISVTSLRPVRTIAD